MTPDGTAAPRFLLDRGLGSRIVPAGLRAAGWHITTMDERYGVKLSQTVADTRWIEEATDRGECLLTKDVAIAKVLHEARAIYMNDARLFALADAQQTGPEMLSTLLHHEEAIYRWASSVRRPYVASVGASGVRRLRLRYPD